VTRPRRGKARLPFRLQRAAVLLVCTLVGPLAAATKSFRNIAPKARRVVLQRRCDFQLLRLVEF
jgi:hypothetical protein